jgi:hypothetical protein
MQQSNDLTTEIEGIPFNTVDEAIQHTNASGRGVVVSVEGIDGYLVVEQRVADAIAATGTYLAYFLDHELSDGSWRIISVPVND